MSAPALLDSNPAKNEAFARSLDWIGHGVSHELRQPLCVVTDMSRWLASDFGDKLGNRAAKYINLTADGAARILVVVGKTLQYWRLSTLEKPLELVDCQEICQNALVNLKPTIEESGANLTLESLPKVMGDASRLLQLFENLLANAISFRGNNPPHIHVSARQSGFEWEITVRDDGIGIDPKDFARLFLPFQRLHANDESAGMGIGLAICKRIVAQHGGRIWVESAPGEGSAIHFTIPIIDAQSSPVKPSKATASQSELGMIPQVELWSELLAEPLREIETRLTALDAPVDGLQGNPPLDPEAREYAARIPIELARAHHLVRVLLEFAGLALPKLVWTDVRDLLGGLRVLLEPYLQALGIRLEIEFQKDLRIHADPGQLKQVLNELVQNAADSIGEERETALSHGSESVPSQMHSQGPETEATPVEPADRIKLRAFKGKTLMDGLQRECVLFEVEDTGPGIPPEWECRIFKPFFSTKPGRAGVGLARSARIIENHGGILNFQTQSGKGIIFRIALPAETAP
jgi:signal transduction histidine kinase